MRSASRRYVYYQWTGPARQPGREPSQLHGMWRTERARRDTRDARRGRRALPGLGCRCLCQTAMYHQRPRSDTRKRHGTPTVEPQSLLTQRQGTRARRPGHATACMRHRGAHTGVPAHGMRQQIHTTVPQHAARCTGTRVRCLHTVTCDAHAASGSHKAHSGKGDWTAGARACTRLYARSEHHTRPQHHCHTAVWPLGSQGCLTGPSYAIPRSRTARDVPAGCMRFLHTPVPAGSAGRTLSACTRRYSVAPCRGRAASVRPWGRYALSAAEPAHVASHRAWWVRGPCVCSRTAAMRILRACAAHASCAHCGPACAATAPTCRPHDAFGQCHPEPPGVLLSWYTLSPGPLLRHARTDWRPLLATPPGPTPFKSRVHGRAWCSEHTSDTSGICALACSACVQRDPAASRTPQR